jgi:hypothetical protein
MIALPSNVRVWLACGHTDMRRGFDGLASQVQQHLGHDPFKWPVFRFPRQTRSTPDILHTVFALRRLPTHGTRWQVELCKYRPFAAAKT